MEILYSADTLMIMTIHYPLQKLIFNLWDISSCKHSNSSEMVSTSNHYLMLTMFWDDGLSKACDEAEGGAEVAPVLGLVEGRSGGICSVGRCNIACDK